MARPTESDKSGKDEHVKTTSHKKPGFLERLGETSGGMLGGLLLFLFSFYVLFSNEGRTLKTQKSLDEGLSLVVPLNDFYSIQPQHEGKLVHLSGYLATLQALHDPNYGISIFAVRLQRRAEMYQWVEYEDTREYEEDGEKKKETKYSYSTEWRSDVVNSRNFDREIGHQNPSSMGVESFTAVAPLVKVQEFSLSRGLTDKIMNFKRIRLTRFVGPHMDIMVQDDYFYQSNNPKYPEVGDLRVAFYYAGLSGESSFLGQPDLVTIVAQQEGDRLVPYKTQSGDILELLYEEQLSAKEVFEKEHAANTVLTWSLRFGGWLLMFVGINLMTKIFHTLVDWFPIVRDLVDLGLTVFAVCVATTLTLLTIAAGWLFYRPFMAVLIAALAALPIFLAKSQDRPKML
uniref:Transmembrane protein 43 n=2 Tax=Callorhinchus milii TaxID=7868 RepID=A0A4W3K728_CALMI|eukprot:gi/632946461/ref/XP_007888570.1/ PREDICTED: transmembrane protein 43 [Callorhinchus milii]